MKAQCQGCGEPIKTHWRRRRVCPSCGATLESAPVAPGRGESAPSGAETVFDPSFLLSDLDERPSRLSGDCGSAAPASRGSEKVVAPASRGSEKAPPTEVGAATIFDPSLLFHSLGDEEEDS